VTGSVCEADPVIDRSRRRLRLLTAPLVLGLALGGLSACGGDDDNGGGGGDDGATPEEVLAAAKKNLDETSGVNITLATKDLPGGVTGITSAEGVKDGMRVASCFPRLTQEFFAKRGQQVVVVPVSGAAEIAPHLGIADIVVDLTSTGSTLKMNGLREVVTVLESSARLVACKRNDAEAAYKLAELKQALGSVLAARGKRYLMANVPRKVLGQVREVLPGLNGPTVVDIMNGGDYVAVHAVVPAKTIYRTINALKAVGCEGILVTRIERLMP